MRNTSVFALLFLGLLFLAKCHDDDYDTKEDIAVEVSNIPKIS